MDPAPARYVIRINGHLGATVLSAFPAAPYPSCERLRSHDQCPRARPGRRPSPHPAERSAPARVNRL